MSASSLVAEAVWMAMESTRSVTDDQLSTLHFLFGKNFERATKIVDQRGVKRITGEPSGRSVFQSIWSSSLECGVSSAEIYLKALNRYIYQLADNRNDRLTTKLTSAKTMRNLKNLLAKVSNLVLGESRRKEEYFCFPENYCGCYSFFYDIVNRGEQLCCKHQLAARLAASLGACIEVKVSDEQLVILLSNL